MGYEQQWVALSFLVRVQRSYFEGWRAARLGICERGNFKENIAVSVVGR